MVPVATACLVTDRPAPLSPAPLPFDRFQVAAAVDRLIYADEATFDPDDARLVLAQLPRVSSPWFQFGIAGKFSGGSRKGFAAGVGDVRIKDKERQFEYSSANDAYSRAGQWKLMWIGRRGRQFVEIEQVMADVTDEGRGAMICYDALGGPLRMDIRVNRSFSLFWTPMLIVIPGWKPWKVPRSPAS